MFEGEPPAREPLNMDADAFCREAQQRPAYARSVEVNANRTLKNVFVYAKEGVTGSYAVPSEPVILDQRGCQFSPHVFGIQVGQPLRIVNSDASYHNVHAFARINREFDIGQPSAGFQTTKWFEAAEVPVRLSCDLHKWMVAYAGVLPHPYFAVTNGAGAFEIKGVLPGNFVIGAWHERYGLQTQAVAISGEESKTMIFKFRERRSGRWLSAPAEQTLETARPRASPNTLKRHPVFRTIAGARVRGLVLSTRGCA